ncbi:2-isopropylmalate synthase [candidate division WOR-3 bacterium]|nr:2-isopropylmalate synthase [candidate division WOR-3 bacterium]
MQEKVYIFDTTLRDGEQAPGFSMNVDEKVKLALHLQRLNVDCIEAGFAITSEGDFEAITEVSKALKGPEVASLARVREKDIDRAWAALKYAKKPRIHVFIATSDIHMKHKLEMEEDEVLEAAVKGVEYACKYTNNVEFSAEDATRTRPEFLAKVCKSVIKAGAKAVNIPDTVGYTTPEEFSKLITYLKDEIKNKAIISVHCHNDLGLGVANSLAAVKAGARQVECTINGIGERAGNASMEELVMIINTRKDLFNFKTDINTKHIYPTSRALSLITGVQVQPNKAIVGKNAFAHEAGIHQDGVMKEKSTYEIMKPEDIGLPSNELILGKHSGRHALRNKLEALGYQYSDEEIDKLFKKFKALADKKKEIYDEDLEMLVAAELFTMEEKYKLLSANFSGGTDVLPSATIEIEVDGKGFKEEGSGDGPVDAIYDAIRKVVPDKVRIDRFSISAITGGSDAQGEVTVFIEEDGIGSVGRAAKTDIVIASAEALVNALNRLVLKKKMKEKKEYGV